MKRILIVDDEESILTVLKSSLTLSNEDYQVITASSGDEALDQLHQFTFDLVVTDYLMAGLDGLELMTEINLLQPGARVIMISAYGTDELESEADGLQVYRYLEKPIEIDTFRAAVKEALGIHAETQSFSAQSIQSGTALFEKIEELTQLQKEVSARCVLVTDMTGRIIAQSGDFNLLNLEALTSFLSQGFDKLIQAGETIDREPESVNLAYRESKLHNLYAISIGQTHLLILVIDRGEYSNRLGTVWFYARQTAIALKKFFNSSSVSATGK